MNKTWKTHPSQLALKNHWKKQSITINYTTTTMNCSSVAGNLRISTLVLSFYRL